MNPERETTTHPLTGMFGEHGGSDTVSVSQHRLTISDGEGGSLVLEPVEYGDYRHRVAARGRQQRVSVLLSDTALTELARYAAAAAPRVEPADYDTAVRASQDRVEAIHRRALNAVTTVITGQRADIASKGGAHMVVDLVERAVHLAVDEVLLAVSEPDTPVPAYQLRLIRRALAVAALVRSVEPAPIATSQERTM